MVDSSWLMVASFFPYIVDFTINYELSAINNFVTTKKTHTFVTGLKNFLLVINNAVSKYNRIHI